MLKNLWGDLMCRNNSRVKTSLAFGVGLLVASLLPTKAVCVIAAAVLIFTCFSCGRFR